MSNRQRTQGILILVHSLKSSSLESTLLKTLVEMSIPFELIEVSAKHPSPLPDRSEIVCIISHPHSKCQMFALHHFPSTPLILIPPAEKSVTQSLKNLQEAANSPIGAPTLALGKAGETNAALFAASLIALNNSTLRKKLHAFREKQTAAVLKATL